MLKNYKIISILVILLVMLSVIASIAGLFSVGGSGEYLYTSINGEAVKIYGEGLYKNDSYGMVAQGKASDFVTLILGVPLLILSLYLVRRNSFRGKLMLTGTVAYFLYTYMSYTFLWSYNYLFLIYVFNMSISLYSFILLLISFDMKSIKESFLEKTPIRFFGSIQILIGFAIGIMWISKLVPNIITGKVPVGLDHYTTFVIQGMDLGIIVPAAFISGILIIKGKPAGYLLTSIILIKGLTMLSSISAMIVNQYLKGVEMSSLEIVLFSIINIIVAGAFLVLMKCVKH